MIITEMLAEISAQIRKDIPRLMELREGCLLYNKSRVYLDFLKTNKEL